MHDDAWCNQHDEEAAFKCLTAKTGTGLPAIFRANINDKKHKQSDKKKRDQNIIRRQTSIKKSNKKELLQPKKKANILIIYIHKSNPCWVGTSIKVFSWS